MDQPARSDLTDLSDQQRWALYAKCLDSGDREVRANAVICLIHQANFLLDRQITTLERQFVNEGGYSEQLAAARIDQRLKTKDRSDRSDWSGLAVICPIRRIRQIGLIEF